MLFSGLCLIFLYLRPHNNIQHKLDVPLCLRITMFLLFSPLLHTINHRTLNSDWHNSPGLALLVLKPGEYISSSFCATKWTLRRSSTSPRTLRLPLKKKKKLGDGWALLMCRWRTQEERGGGGWQANDWEDSLLFQGWWGPFPSDQLAIPSATA